MYEYICLDVHINLCNAMDLRASTAAARALLARGFRFTPKFVYTIYTYIFRSMRTYIHMCMHFCTHICVYV